MASIEGVMAARDWLLGPQARYLIVLGTAGLLACGGVPPEEGDGGPPPAATDDPELRYLDTDVEVAVQLDSGSSAWPPTSSTILPADLGARLEEAARDVTTDEGYPWSEVAAARVTSFELTSSMALSDVLAEGTVYAAGHGTEPVPIGSLPDVPVAARTASFDLTEAEMGEQLTAPGALEMLLEGNAEEPPSTVILTYAVTLRVGVVR